MAQRVIQHADGWMTCTAAPEEFHACWVELQGHARAAGRDPATIVPAYQMLCHIDNDRAKARAIGVEFVNRYYHSAYGSLDEARWGQDPYGTAEDCGTFCGAGSTRAATPLHTGCSTGVSLTIE
jgi:alkanesulfonate monooxygenase SsuD/methylene tetrahydromethanopterin reductase-like flavin-dependent oxidoreductase (luciferase family)